MFAVQILKGNAQYYEQRISNYASSPSKKSIEKNILKKC